MSGVEAQEITPDESREIAARFIRAALRDLDKLPASHDADHVRMYLSDALIYLRPLA